MNPKPFLESNHLQVPVAKSSKNNEGALCDVMRMPPYTRGEGGVKELRLEKTAKESGYKR
jgi:hypothetical protein